MELSDARGECRPLPSREPDEGGYGLLLVATPATAWGVRDWTVGKTVWATVPAGRYQAKRLNQRLSWTRFTPSPGRNGPCHAPVPR